VDPILASLFLDLSNIPDEEAEEKTFQEYIKLYTDHETHTGMVGERCTHDSEPVMFYEDRFDHAFFISAHRTSRPYNKDEFQKDRATRVRWIGEIIKGNIDGTECWRVPDPDRRDSSGGIIVKRLYILRDENYVIWLEPLKTGRWKFSSAYPANKGYIRQITKRGTLFWCKKISRD
jgi:hypothetical protein